MVYGLSRKRTNDQRSTLCDYRPTYSHASQQRSGSRPKISSPAVRLERQLSGHRATLHLVSLYRNSDRPDSSREEADGFEPETMERCSAF